MAGLLDRKFASRSDTSWQMTMTEDFRVIPTNVLANCGGIRSGAEVATFPGVRTHEPSGSHFPSVWVKEFYTG